ncbi:MAG TPA: HAD-IA family hydrolase [Candidatus Angelobacter sp.]|nr:HAD-IA family hydrolase [Candidatus Angelobacter sp.]
MNFESITLITFDCYGTLIDWETGILKALQPLFARNGNPLPDTELLKHYGEIEAESESGPYLRYHDVLARTAEQMGQRLGVKISSEQAIGFAESLPSWEPFPDTVAGLQTLTKKFQLGIISNIDDDLFAQTRRKLPVQFAVVVTAQQVQSYKPSLKNFEEAIKRSGRNKNEILHAGQSLYHDVAPANSLGIKNVWVNRPSIVPNSGAAKPGVAQPGLEVHSLAELAGLMVPAEA